MDFDAIVIGSGISGGWAAKELCEKGLRTCVIERGRHVAHQTDYPTANVDPWEIPHGGALTHKFKQDNPLITKAAGFAGDTKHFFIQDKDQVYIQKKPFDWIRGYQTGGKSLIWGRACQRWSPHEFSAPQKDNYGIEWPITYDQIAPWYSYVESFIGVCGNKDGLEAMPDGDFLPPFEMNCVETHMKEVIREKFDRHVVHGRWAHLTEPREHHLAAGRGKCQSRNLCMRGCPYGAYFSSNSSTLPAAEKTGLLTLISDSIAIEILYDEATQKARGVVYLNTKTGEKKTIEAKVIFVNASTINTNFLLLNSKSKRFPHGLGNDHDILGRYICFHNYRGNAHGTMPGFQDKYVYGKNPSELIIANYRNIQSNKMPFKGGYTLFSGAYRARDGAEIAGIGKSFKAQLRKPGKWQVYMYMQGETIPKHQNQVMLASDAKDKWGLPQVEIQVDYDANDEAMVADFLKESEKMLRAIGCENIETSDSKQAPGLDIHEMGGCRMGNDPKTSMLNAHNQLHQCKNVFVTDGACMTSTGNQSPSLLYMALTARAVAFAHEAIKQNTL